MIKKITLTITTIFCFAMTLCLCTTVFARSDFAYAEEEEEIDSWSESDLNYDDVLESPISCPHAKCTVEGTMQAGSLVEVSIYDFEEGYALDCVLITSGGEAVVASRSANKYSFVMPDGKITIKVFFKESVAVVEETKTIGTKEIVAICVAGAILVVGGVVIFIKNKPQIFKKGKK